MTKDEIKQGIFDVIIRKNLIEPALVFEMIEIMGEDKFHDFLFRLSGQTLIMPSAERIWREYRNELIGRTLDECDNRFVRKELREYWNLSSANLSKIYRKYQEDVESGQYDEIIKMNEHEIQKIEMQKKKGRISSKDAHRKIITLNQFIAQRKKDLEFSLKLAAAYYPESLDSGKDDIFAKALRRVRKQIRDSEAAKVRKVVRNQKSFFKEK
jgi:hypothetical protein